jgi:hypothetical protein
MLQIHYLLIHVAYGTSKGSVRIVTGLNYEPQDGDPITTRFPCNLLLEGGGGGREEINLQNTLQRNNVNVPKTVITYNSKSFRSPRF